MFSNAWPAQTHNTNVAFSVWLLPYNEPVSSGCTALWYDDIVLECAFNDHMNAGAFTYAGIQRDKRGYLRPLAESTAWDRTEDFGGVK